MRLVLVGLAGLTLAACVSEGDINPRYPRAPGAETARGPIGTYDKKSPPDTPYEVRRREIERDEQIAGKGGPSYPKLFKDQKDDNAEDTGS